MEKNYVSKDSEFKLNVSEPLSQWGGLWTEEKLDTFTKYVNAYLTIMNKQRNKYGWELIYFDGFAGSGSRCEEINNPSGLLLELFQGDRINQDELNLYQGAAERVLSIEQPGFDYNYFIDNNSESTIKLQKKLVKFSSEKKKLIFRCSDANEQVRKLADALKKSQKLKALVLLDPFGMQVNWDSIKALANTSTDLWILIPTGVIVNRLLDRKAELKHIEILSSFFGLSEIEIRNYFYKKEIIQTLFGKEEIISKVNQPIKKIAELYIKQLSKIFHHVTDKPLVLYNTRNTPIFHFAFASNNATAKNIATQIINKRKIK